MVVTKQMQKTNKFFFILYFYTSRILHCIFTHKLIVYNVHCTLWKFRPNNCYKPFALNSYSSIVVVVLIPVGMYYYKRNVILLTLRSMHAYYLYIYLFIYMYVRILIVVIVLVRVSKMSMIIGLTVGFDNLITAPNRRPPPTPPRPLPETSLGVNDDVLTLSVYNAQHGIFFF